MSTKEIISLLVIALLLITGWLVLYIGNKRKNKFGINTSELKCPTCGLAAPATRKPKNTSEALWGGFTCEQCGAEVNKWGKLK